MPVDQHFNRDALALLNNALPQGDALQSAYEQLKPTQKQFVDHFLATDNPSEAYLRVHPHLRAPEMKQRIYPRIFELMRMPLVQAAIRERQKELSNRMMITAEMVKAEIGKVAFASLKKYTALDASGSPIVGDWNDLTDDDWAALAEITSETYTEGRGEDAREVKRVKYKTHPKLEALEKLAKILGMYAPEKLEITGKDGQPIRQDIRAVTMNLTPEQAAEEYARTLEGE